MKTTSLSGGEIIAQVLQKQGVKFLFTLCGGHISPIFVSAQKAGIRVIDTRHEVTSVYAADAVARLTGVPGVATVTAGPGLTNTITALQNAYLAQSPLVLLGGAAATILKGRGSLQDIDQMKLMRPNVKWAATIKKVKDIAPTLEKAFQIAKEGVPGPVFVECPIDTLYGEDLVRGWYGAKGNDARPQTIKEKVIRWYINRHARKLFDGNDKIQLQDSAQASQAQSVSVDRVHAAAKMISNSKRPLLLIGSGALLNPTRANELALAVQKLGIPTYLSGMARGLLGKDHALQLRHHRKEAIKESDLIILAGVPNDFRLDYGNHIGGRKFISLNLSKHDLNLNKRPTLGVLGDPASFLIELSKNSNRDLPDWILKLRTRDLEREKKISEQASAPVTRGINPIQLFRELDPALEEKSILVADGGDFVATGAYTLRPRSPLSWLDPGVFGTLGVGAGFALGAKLVHPEKEVWIIYGDGSSGYSLIENDTFVRHKIGVISLIGNDACWSQIARDQIEHLKSDCAMNLAFSNYQNVAKALGGEGARVETLEEFKKAIAEARSFSQKGLPFVINAIIGQTDFRKGSMSV